MKKRRFRRSLKERQDLFRQYGGSLFGDNGNARESRPLSTEHSMHLVLRSELARGEWSMRHRRHHKKVDQIVRSQARRWGLKIYEYANVGNHLHILLKVSSRKNYSGFIRAISGLIARTVSQSQRGQRLGQRFWQHKPFSRVVLWGKAFMQVKKYIKMNAQEALGRLSPRQIKDLEERGLIMDEANADEIRLALDDMWLKKNGFYLILSAAYLPNC